MVRLGGSSDRRARGAPRVWPFGVAVVCLMVVVVATPTGSVLGPGEELALGALLLGCAVAFGIVDGRRSDPPPGREPDESTAALAGQVLAALDGVEHRRVELGRPWPQLAVGPAGVAVVDVCGIEGPLVVTATGIRRCDEPDHCVRCSSTFTVADRARRTLAMAGVQAPVRAVAVVAAGTEVRVEHDAPADAHVVTADGLADTLVRGPLLPMPVVDAAFAVITGMDAVPHGG